MRLVLAAFGRLLLDVRVLEDDDEDEPEAIAGDTTSVSLGALVSHADHWPLGFVAEPAPDRWPFYD